MSIASMSMTIKYRVSPTLELQSGKSASFQIPNGLKLPQPHRVLWPQPGQMPAGEDIQLEKATEELMKDVEKWQAEKRPTLLKASDREGRPRR
jgi:hypothetical protein